MNNKLTSKDIYDLLLAIDAAKHLAVGKTSKWDNLNTKLYEMLYDTRKESEE